MPPRFSRSRDNRIWSFVYVSPTRKNVTLFIVAIQARELQFRRRRSDIVGESRCEGKGDGVLNLTNQRTDAVAMSVLDPVEVAEVEVWVLDLEGKDKVEAKRALAAAEYTVFKRVLDASKLKFVLNEKDIAATARMSSHSHIAAALSHPRSTKHGSIVTSELHNALRQLPTSQRSSWNEKFRRVCAELSTFKRFVSRSWLTNGSTK